MESDRSQAGEDGGIILDWLSFTLPYEDGLGLVEELLGELTSRPSGIRGYSHSASVLGTGVVGWSPDRVTQGVHVELPASALNRLREVDPIAASDIGGLLACLLGLRARMRRVDLALDDHLGQLSMSQIQEYIEQSAFVSRWRTVDRIYRMVGGSGDTLYFGSRTSSSFLRIYNKQAERVDAGEDDPGHWIRVELELKGDKAHSMAQRYTSEGIGLATGLLRGLLEFKEPGEDVNKSRWPVAEWWLEFLRRAEKQRLSMPEEGESIERSWRWMTVQWPRALARLIMAEGGSLELVEFLIEKGSYKLTESDRLLAEQHLLAKRDKVRAWDEFRTWVEQAQSESVSTEGGEREIN